MAYKLFHSVWQLSAAQYFAASGRQAASGKNSAVAGHENWESPGTRLVTGAAGTYGEERRRKSLPKSCQKRLGERTRCRAATAACRALAGAR